MISIHAVHGVLLLGDGQFELTSAAQLHVVFGSGDEDAGVSAGDFAVEIYAIEGIDLIHAEGLIIPVVGLLIAGGDGVVIAIGGFGSNDADDGGFDGDGLTIFQFGFSEAEGEFRGARLVHVVGGDATDEDGSAGQFGSITKLNLLCEGGVKHLTGSVFVGVEGVIEGGAGGNHAHGLALAAEVC